MIRGLLLFFTSLRLTVVLLGFSMALVFFGTLDQVNYGIHETQKRYFESFVVFWNPLPPYSDSNWARLALPLPGGYLLGTLLLINLVAAQTYRFRWSWKKSGILLIHVGLVLLILSEFVTDFFAEERQMWIDEGGTKNWSETYLENEIVFIDQSDPEVDTVYAINADHLRAGDWVEDERLPFRFFVEAYLPNATIRPTGPEENLPRQATQGLAQEMGLFASWVPETFVDNEINADTAVIRIFDQERDLGSWMVSNLLDERFPPQQITIAGREFELALRFKRTYYPFSVTLADFTHKKYPGTEIPKDFSSRVIVTDPTQNIERESLIYMNHPLRYDGHTFYQASFANQDTSSMLQVVNNPGWTLPYLSVFLVGLGLCVQFGIGLSRSRSMRSTQRATPKEARA
ncbi:MAG: cytochrome c biogenesis protein ResB [Verrucomicrobiota bacterium]